MGNIYRKLKDTSKAITAYHNCIKYSKIQYPYVYINLGSLYFELGNILKSAKYFARSLEKSTSSNRKTILAALADKGFNELIDNSSILEGLIKYFQGDYAGTIRIFQEKYSSLSKNVVVNFYLADAYEKTGRKDDALLYFKQILLYEIFN